MDPPVKKEAVDAELPLCPVVELDPLAVIDLSSSCTSSRDSDSDDDDGCVGTEVNPGVSGQETNNGRSRKKSRRGKSPGIHLPPGFLEPLSPEELHHPPPRPVARVTSGGVNCCRQFWKAGDYEGGVAIKSSSHSTGMDHVRVHPKFLHSNATSHKWSLGAIAELLDNALDEVTNGATFVKVDMLENTKDSTRMLLVEDNGGGMDPDRMRKCMSLGYSIKSKMPNTIGQYGNGFKTSTMRLGADVIVFSRHHEKGESSSTQSVGMLSYTFLRSTRQEDIIVPMLDYEKKGETWNMLVRSSLVDWNRNLETILHWSPYRSEADLLHQFRYISDQGTRIVIYNLWEDDQGDMELDFDADKFDIQIRGVNRDVKKIEMAKQFPNLKHFLTFRHSLRSYASILYLRLPQGFSMVLRGKEIEHHNFVNDMILKQEVTYKPQSFGDGITRDQNMMAIVTIGFVKDAKDHLDVQGFNVYHKNRLIKPFWRVWNVAGSEGRGVIGVLEANFVEPAHDKQGFERTTVLSRLEARLIQMQRNYWKNQAHKIGYAPRIKEKILDNINDRGIVAVFYNGSNILTHFAVFSTIVVTICIYFRPFRLDMTLFYLIIHFAHQFLNNVECSCLAVLPEASMNNAITHVRRPQDPDPVQSSGGKGSLSPIDSKRMGNIFMKGQSSSRTAKKPEASQLRVHELSYRSNDNDSDLDYASERRNLCQRSSASSDIITGRSCSREVELNPNRDERNSQQTDVPSLRQLKHKNIKLKDRLRQVEEESISLTKKIEEAQNKLELVNKKQETLIDIFSEEKCRRDREEESMRKKIKDASIMIEDLQEKLHNRSKKGEC